MCNKLISLAYQCELKSSLKAVLVCLADHASAQNRNRCWPSIARIARRTGLKPRTVQYALKEMEREGHITRYFQSGATTQYLVHPRISCTPATPAPVQNKPRNPAKEGMDPRKICGETPKNPKTNPDLAVPAIEEKPQRLSLWEGAKPIGDFAPLVLARLSNLPKGTSSSGTDGGQQPNERRRSTSPFKHGLPDY